ncbi:GntR family transcriptional regulator [Mycolicibacter senuensis]|uniref:FadR family transcriptional regulator n=2 Tax=Mycobacteriaceae TaxID=1762 RepID=A0A7K3L6H5_9MYCO|nr:FadR family transcriptional regulator [Mycolicibacter kumamotonensis]RAV02865.1 GntR family transcriptional regulator [Mycolicibacter senuensis]
MAELIGSNLRKQIVRGELREGDALPSEATLMEQFGVSRPTLREAFRVLESEALITIRRGAHGGARVNSPDGRMAARYAGLVLEHRGTTLRDVFDARSIIESTCAGEAAKSRTKEDLARLRFLCREITDTSDSTSRIALHARFDAAVVEASHNQTMIVLSSMLRTIIDKSTLQSVQDTAGSPATVKAYEDAHRAHLRLVDLIDKKNVTAARAHWKRHLDLAEEFVLSTGVAGHSVLDLL